MTYQFLLSRLVLPLFEKWLPSNFWRVRRSFLALDSASQQETGAHQLKRLAKLLSHAERNVPIWCRVIRDVNGGPQKITESSVLSTLRFISVSHREIYVKNFPDQVTSYNTEPALNAQLQSKPNRLPIVVDRSKTDYLNVAESLNTLYTFSKPISEEILDILPQVNSQGSPVPDINPKNPPVHALSNLKGGDFFGKKIVSDIVSQIESEFIYRRGSVLLLKPSKWSELCVQLDSIIDHIILNKIRVVRALPHFLLWLAARISERKIDIPSVTKLIPHGGLASEAMIKRIERAFDAKFVNVYCVREVGSLGIDDGNGGVTAYPGMGFLEVVDSKDNPLGVGKIGRLIVTDFNNYTMPLVRYEIGDIVKILDQNTVSGSVTRFRILGPKQESFYNAQRRIVNARDLQNLFFSYPEIINFKLLHLGDERFEVLYCSLKNVDIHVLAKKLKLLLGANYSIEFTRLSYIQANAEGKFRTLGIRASRIKKVMNTSAEAC